MHFRPVNFVSTHINATINLSVALHTDPSQIDNHDISFIKDELESQYKKKKES
jgi:hypothetical protein